MQEKYKENPFNQKAAYELIAFHKLLAGNEMKEEILMIADGCKHLCTNFYNKKTSNYMQLNVYIISLYDDEKHKKLCFMLMMMYHRQIAQLK